MHVGFQIYYSNGTPLVWMSCWGDRERDGAEWSSGYCGVSGGGGTLWTTNYTGSAPTNGADGDQIFFFAYDPNWKLFGWYVQISPTYQLIDTPFLYYGG